VLPLACRQGGDPPVAPEPIQFSPRFSLGDSYRFDALLIDEYGYYVPSSRGVATQRIVGTNGTYEGMTGVYTVLDSMAILRDTTAVVQYFSLAQSADGDLYRFGFLKEMARILKLPAVPAQWDRVARFSQGLGNSWIVGYLDTAHQKAVYGNLGGLHELWVAKVNGVQRVFSCYRVDILGGGVNFRFWISDSPAGFLRYTLEPGDTTEGMEMELIDMRVAAP